MIVAIDDDKEILELYEMMFEDHEVVCFDDPMSGFTFIQEYQDKIRLVLMDNLMTPMDGFTMAKSLRLAKVKLPIFLVTGCLDDKQVFDLELFTNSLPFEAITQCIEKTSDFRSEVLRIVGPRDKESE